MKKSDSVIFITAGDIESEDQMNEIGDLLSNCIIPLVSNRLSVDLIVDCVSDFMLGLRSDKCHHRFEIDDSGEFVRCVINSCNATFPLDSI